MRKFLIYWYYFWGNLISKPMYWFDLGYLYPYYNKWMSESADYDTKELLWKSEDKQSKDKP